MFEHKNGETIGQRYNRLVEHARKLDPRFVGGVASVPELARVEQSIVTFSKQAAEKEANQPIRRAWAIKGDLVRRAHEARRGILQSQEDLKAHRRKLDIIGMPAQFLETPDPIPETSSTDSVEKLEASNEQFARQVADLELTAQKLSRYLGDWVRLTSEQQIWKVLFAIAERLDG